MKKLKSSCTNMALVLTLIAVLAGGLLAFVNGFTKDKIAQIKLENEKAAISEVLGGGSVNLTDTVVVAAKKGSKDSIYVYVTEKGEYAVKTVDPANASFGGGLTLMVGFDKDFNVKGYTVLETNETPGLGAKAGDWFKKEYKDGGVLGANPVTKPLVVKKDGGDVDAITASTITSRAFLSAINRAGEACKEAAGVNTGGETNPAGCAKTDASPKTGCDMQEGCPMTDCCMQEGCPKAGCEMQEGCPKAEASCCQQTEEDVAVPANDVKTNN